MALGDNRKLGHLYYGGSTNPSGSLSSKPQAQRQFRTQRRIEDIIRLENAGFSPVAIGAMLCISKRRVEQIKASPEYLEARIRITHGIILDRDARLSEIKAQRKEYLTQLLPSAWQFLAEEIQKPAQTLAERKHKLTLTQDLLDREGTFAKVSRTEIKPVDSFDFEKADAESMAVIAALKGVTPNHVHHTFETVEANEKFSNSHTLSAVDQQAALDSLEEEVIAEALALMPTNGEVN
jgi:hypothetical protein